MKLFKKNNKTEKNMKIKKLSDEYTTNEVKCKIMLLSNKLVSNIHKNEFVISHKNLILSNIEKNVIKREIIDLKRMLELIEYKLGD